MTGGSVFIESGTFMGVPGGAEVGAAKAAVLGIPFDCGVPHP